MKDARLNAPLMKSTDAVVEPVHQEEQPEWMKPKPYKTTVSNPYLRRSYPQALGMLRTLFVWVRDKALAALPASTAASLPVILWHSLHRCSGFEYNKRELTS
jgi:hypothetical protein